jgi:hypothetical protein
MISCAYILALYNIHMYCNAPLSGAVFLGSKSKCCNFLHPTVAVSSGTATPVVILTMTSAALLRYTTAELCWCCTTTFALLSVYRGVMTGV